MSLLFRRPIAAFTSRLAHRPPAALAWSLPRRAPSQPYHSPQSTHYAAGKMLGGCKLKEAFNKGEGASFGFWQCLPGAEISRTMARTPGVDWIMVDGEHGIIDDSSMHDAVPAIASCGASPIVRIPGMEDWMIKRALDTGAHGVLVPLVRTVEETKRIVSATKFPPLGHRGFGSPFSMERFNPIPTSSEYLQKANSSLLTMVQIETKEALEAVDEIAAVPGVDVIFVGPFDLGNNIGAPIIDNVVKPELHEAIDRILAAARKAGIKAGFFASGGQHAKVMADKGWDMVSVSIDVFTLGVGSNLAIKAAQGAQ